MIDIKKRKVKAIYFNAFHCPECGLELHQDNIVLTTYPAQYCYYCDCGFRTTSFQQPGIEYEFEDEDLPPAYPKRIAECFDIDKIVDRLNESPLSSFAAVSSGDISKLQTTCTVNTAEAVTNIKAIQEAFADSMGYAYV